MGVVKDFTISQKSSNKLSARSLCLVLRKKELRAEYRPRPTKEKARNNPLTVPNISGGEQPHLSPQENRESAV
jgi:hypothetical protein